MNVWKYIIINIKITKSNFNDMCCTTCWRYRNPFDVGMPKQFYLIASKPILIHSLEAFLKVEEMDEIIVSSPKECVNKTKDVIKEYDLTDPRITVIEGGKRRSDTILNSINYT